MGNQNYITVNRQNIEPLNGNPFGALNSSRKGKPTLSD